MHFVARVAHKAPEFATFAIEQVRDTGTQAKEYLKEKVGYDETAGGSRTLSASILPDYLGNLVQVKVEVGSSHLGGVPVKKADIAKKAHEIVEANAQSWSQQLGLGLHGLLIHPVESHSAEELCGQPSIEIQLPDDLTQHAGPIPNMFEKGHVTPIDHEPLVDKYLGGWVAGDLSKKKEW